MDPDNVLITQGFLYNIAGSETVTYELAEYFSARARSVTVVSHGYNDNWGEEFAALPNCVLLRSDSPVVAERLAEFPPDLAWLHHQLVPESVLRKRPATVVFNHMSSAHPLEYPIAPTVVRSIASLFTFNAEEIRTIQKDSGLLDGIDDDHLALFGNPAPDAYLVEDVPAKSRLRRIIVVSNHLPDEVVSAVQQLRSEHEIEVEIFGLEDAKDALASRITPTIVSDADAVLTIGKTVQYSIAAGTPVYCYDKFGGPGWLSPDNFDRAASYNFSGRSFTQRTATELVAEIVDGFETAAADAITLHRAHGSEMTMSRRMPLLLERATANAPLGGELSEIEILGHLKLQESLGTYIRIAAENEALRRAQVSAITEALTEAREYVAEVQGSQSYLLAQRLSKAANSLRGIPSKILPGRQSR